ncbi:unnamed protein product [Pedinophyceae sp. YPF-701]|nr:unnamed protein product [Pedinophyceae sp. YPF-701]
MGSSGPASGHKDGVEVEVKLRLPDAEAHGKVLSLLSGSLGERHEQENYFFDGTEGELEQTLSVLRVRFYDVDKKATVTLKGKAVMEDGVGRAKEMEASLDPAKGREALKNPDVLLGLDCPVMAFVRKKFGEGVKLRCLGGFDNFRQEAHWEGQVLEVDETKFEWGTLYEIEAETAEPEALKGRLEAWLQGADVPYAYSTTTKFANFRNRTLE